MKFYKNYYSPAYIFTYTIVIYINNTLFIFLAPVDSNFNTCLRNGIVVSRPRDPGLSRFHVGIKDLAMYALQN